MTDFHVYDPFEAPMVEVEQSGIWRPGHARMRTTHRDGRVMYQVRWHPGGKGNRLDVSRPSGCGWTPLTAATGAQLANLTG